MSSLLHYNDCHVKTHKELSLHLNFSLCQFWHAKFFHVGMVHSKTIRQTIMERRQTIRGRGRPKKTIREVIKKDLKINGLDRSMVLDRILWRKLIHVADPT